MASPRQSSRAYNAPRLSPSGSTFSLDTDQDAFPPVPKKSILASLDCLNDYIQKHCDRFVADESLKRNRLAASFAQKEQGYQKQITALKAVHVDIAGLLSREQTSNADLRQELDNAASSVVRLCKLVTDANFVFVDCKQVPHEIKQEEGLPESTSVTDVAICPDASVSALLSRIETVVTEINAQNGAGLPSPVDFSPCYSVVGALGKVADSLLVTQRTFVLLQENFKSACVARVGAECQNESLQEKIVLLQGELEQARGDNERISQELAAGTPVAYVLLMGGSRSFSARLEKEAHVCRPPTPPYPTPGKPIPRDSPHQLSLILLPQPLKMISLSLCLLRRLRSGICPLRTVSSLAHQADSVELTPYQISYKELERSPGRQPKHSRSWYSP